MKEKLSYLALVLFVMGVLAYIEINKLEPFENFSLRFNDINFDLQDKKPNKDIVFVAVDEPSVNKFGRWPWDRDIIAEGIDKLDQADIVLMDMIFSEPTTRRADEKLAESISKLPLSVCGFFLRHNSTQLIDEEAEELLSDSSLDLLQSQIVEYGQPQFISAPFAEINILNILESCTLSGSFSTLADNDKLFRSYPLAVYYNETLFPSLGVQAIRLKFNSDIKRVDSEHVILNHHTIYLNERGFVKLNFYKREQYNIVSFLDVIEEKIKPSYFKNKIVIFGITEVGSGDVVSTPIGFLYGPLLHYTFLSNLLEDHLIIEPRSISTFLMLLLAFVPLLFILVVKKIFYRVVLNLSFYLLVYAGVRALFVYNMIYIDLFYPLLSISLSAISIEALAFSFHERKSRFVREAFSSYLSKDLLAKLTDNPKILTLGGEKKELSILFSDIRGFTTISESMDAVDLVYLLNRYFTPMTDAVLKHKGMLDKYIGDALMAFYNAPVDVENHADEACFTALEMIQELDRLNDVLISEALLPIEIGIGINTAGVVVGNIGSDNRFNYTVIGDGVNLASRIESLTKVYGVNILITEFTIEKLHQEFLYRKIEPVVVKGKEKAVLLYELMPDTKNSKEIKLLYDKTLKFYIEGDISKAKEGFTNLIENYDDTVAHYFLQKISQNHPWGVHIMHSK